MGSIISLDAGAMNDGARSLCSKRRFVCADLFHARIRAKTDGTRDNERLISVMWRLCTV